MTIRKALRLAQARLEHAGVPDAKHDARELLAQVLDVKPLDLLLVADKPLDDKQQAAFDSLISRREQREPLQYIIGRAWFMGHEFLTRPGVLIPRSDTEALCEAAIALTKPGDTALDLCCGSGCLGISLKLACPQATVMAGDISPDAIALTTENARKLCAEVIIRQGDLLEPFSGHSFDLILCNPPYIPTHELSNLQEEVRQEPMLALDGGDDGLDFYRRVIQDTLPLLAPGGHLLLELGDHQADLVSALLTPPYQNPRVLVDLSGLPRVLITRKAPE